MVSDIKIDYTFLSEHSFVQGYSVPIGINLSSNGGGMLLFVRDRNLQDCDRNITFHTVLKVLTL